MRSQGEVLSVLPGWCKSRVLEITSAEDVHVSLFGEPGLEGLEGCADEKLKLEGR